MKLVCATVGAALGEGDGTGEGRFRLGLGEGAPGAALGLAELAPDGAGVGGDG
ncbi:MAG: hypothetical protein LC797_16960 [Chloroflexi bacterium]|nr:hypothetical protein [Chloroflexota bacterium]